MHFGTFWNILHAFWNILHTFWNILHTFWNIASLSYCMQAYVIACKLIDLHAFWNILEHSACILEHSAWILEHSACILKYSVVNCCRIFADGHMDRRLVGLCLRSKKQNSCQDDPLSSKIQNLKYNPIQELDIKVNTNLYLSIMPKRHSSAVSSLLWLTFVYCHPV